MSVPFKAFPGYCLFNFDLEINTGFSASNLPMTAFLSSSSDALLSVKNQIQLTEYRIHPKYAWANGVDSDQTPQNAASDQGLNCLTLTKSLRRINR